MKFFNWGQDIKKDKAKPNPKEKEKKEEKMSFKEKMVRFFVCCGPKEKPPKENKKLGNKNSNKG